MTENLNQTIIQLVQKELSDYRSKQLTTVLNLLNEGNTVPFIARYRKEMTGNHAIRKNATSGRFISAIQTETTDKSNDC